MPETEDMPDKTVSVNARGSELTEKVIIQKAQRANYARHVQGYVPGLARPAFIPSPLIV